MTKLEKLKIEAQVLNRLIVKYFEKDDLTDSEVRNLERCIADLREIEKEIEALEREK